MTRLAAAVALWVAALPLAAAQKPPPAGIAAPAGDALTMTARIEAIDYASRVITVRGPLGRTLALKVDDRVRNFGKARAGDEVVLRVAEAAALSLSAHGAGVDARPLPPGRAAAGAAAPTRIVARVEALDAQRQVVLLEGSGARYAEVKVGDPAAFSALRVGQEVDAAYFEAVVVDVVTPKK